MKVYALSGKSGTGKSYQAMYLCRDLKIESIIDDGLFIYRNEIKAGKSAKREETKIGAVKTAMFYDEDHMQAVKKAIIDAAPESILVLGTSDGMVNKITKRLGMDHIDELIHIEDITSEEQREIAYKQRHHQGKHVVPAPAAQLKPQFSGYFMDPMRIFRGFGFGKDSFAEKSVVRPTYSYLGNFFISDRVIKDIVRIVADEIEGVDSIIRINVRNQSDFLEIDLQVVFKSGVSAIETAQRLQRGCTLMIERMTAFNMKSIDVEVKIIRGNSK